MQHLTFSCKNKVLPGYALYATIQRSLRTWLLTSRLLSKKLFRLSNKKSRYVKNILTSTSKSIDQVTIQPDGKWELHSKGEPQSSSRLNGVASDSDDDLIEITKSGDNIRMGTPRASGTTTGGQPSTGLNGISRETSAVSAKRPRPMVIDLTSSGDDDDDEPLVRPTKRQYTSNSTGAPTNLPMYRPPPNGYSPRP
jgi:E3 SUMO-protein ligase PIAS1